MTVRFPLGRLVVTLGALQAFGYEGCFRLFSRHAGCDWGEVDGLPRMQQEGIHEECQEHILAREYALRLFGYTGEFRFYTGWAMRTKRI